MFYFNLHNTTVFIYCTKCYATSDIAILFAIFYLLFDLPEIRMLN